MAVADDEQLRREAAHRPTRRGAFVVVVGPDGAGKTSLATALCESPHVSARYFHFRPLVLTPLLDGPPETEVIPASKGKPHGSRLLGWVRLLRNFVRFWAGYLARVRPATRRGEIVVGDRWAYGYLTQPFMLKYYGPPWLAAAALRLMPEPDLVVNLAGPADLIHARKQELSAAEISREQELWERLPVRTLRTFDASAPVDTLAADVLAALTAQPSSRSDGAEGP